MRVSPYIAFNGTCEQALRFYEKAFGVTALIMRYGETPPSDEYPTTEATANLIAHAQFEVSGETMMFCDMPPGVAATAGTNIAVMVEFDTVDEAKAAFAALKEGGTVTMDIGETFWSKCYGSLIDRFGIAWNISLHCKE